MAEREIRWVGADDPVLRPLIDDLAALYDARYEPTDGVPSSAELTRYPAADFLPSNGGAFVAVLEDGDLVAGGALKRAPEGAAELKRMWTRSDQRRRGLAGLVLELLERRSAELGYDRMELTTGARQPEAVGLYLHHGWVPRFDPAVEQDAAAYLRFDKPITPR